MLAVVTGPARAVLTAERIGLNFAQRMSGIATLTARYVAEVAHTGARIADTRKTTPGLRAFERHAVVNGGGHNHRFSLSDAVMAKDNHLAVLAQKGVSVTAALQGAIARLPHTTHVEVEVDRLDQIEPVLAAGIGTIMLDNFSLDDLRAGVAQVAGRATVEASGGVTLDDRARDRRDRRRRHLGRRAHALRPGARPRASTSGSRPPTSTPMSLLYLDNAATTPVRPEVLEAMMPYLTRWFGNPSSHHTVGEAAADALADARARDRRASSACAPATSSSPPAAPRRTTSRSRASRSRRRRSARADARAGHVVTTPIEHESILESAAYLERVHGFDVTRVPVDARRRASIPDAVAAALRDDTALVTFGYANNEVGTVQDVAAIAAVAHARGVPVHLDAVQAAGWLPLSAAELGADAISIAGHKLGAPKGTGVLAVRGRIPLEPLLHGGGQERGRRSGTEDVAGAVGLAMALELAEAERVEAAARVAALRDRFIARVLAAVPSARLTGDPVHRLPGTASFTFAGTSGEAVLLELERRGVVSSSGSACAAGSDEPSHVLVAMGIAPEVAQTAVRFTFSHGQREPLDAVADAVAASVTAVQSGG